jgi:hypothetical protein
MDHDIVKGVSCPFFHTFPAQCIMALNEITKFEIIANGLDTLIRLLYIFSDAVMSTTAF